MSRISGMIPCLASFPQMAHSSNSNACSVELSRTTTLAIKQTGSNDANVIEQKHNVDLLNFIFLKCISVCGILKKKILHHMVPVYLVVRGTVRSGQK